MNLKGLTILVVDDEELNWLLFKDTLEYSGAEITWARTGQHAIDILHSGYKVDIILMDIKMPIMDGYQATRLIKDAFPLLPVIAQTAYATPEEKDKCFQAGCDGYISKPIDFEEFSTLISRYLKS